jgi:hypothetical protein
MQLYRSSTKGLKTKTCEGYGVGSQGPGKAKRVTV